MAIQTYGSGAARSFAFFASVSLFFRFSLQRFGWKEGEQRFMINSSCVALCHGFIVFIGATQQVLSNPYVLDAKNTDAQENILSFSTGYFIVDVVFLLIYCPKELLYMAHHVVCLLYMMSCASVGHGSYSVMALMALGEVSNPWHNMWHILHEILKEKDAPMWAKKANAVVEPMLNGTFAIARLVGSPIMSLHLAYTFLFTPISENIPYSLCVFWSLVAVGVVIGSQSEGQLRAKKFYANCIGKS